MSSREAGARLIPRSAEAAQREGASASASASASSSLSLSLSLSLLLPPSLPPSTTLPPAPLHYPSPRFSLSAVVRRTLLLGPSRAAPSGAADACRCFTALPTTGGSGGASRSVISTDTTTLRTLVRSLSLNASDAAALGHTPPALSRPLVPPSRPLLPHSFLSPRSGMLAHQRTLLSPKAPFHPAIYAAQPQPHSPSAPARQLATGLRGPCGRRVPRHGGAQGKCRSSARREKWPGVGIGHIKTKQATQALPWYVPWWPRAPREPSKRHPFRRFAVSARSPAAERRAHRAALEPRALTQTPHPRGNPNLCTKPFTHTAHETESSRRLNGTFYVGSCGFRSVSLI